MDISFYSASAGASAHQSRLDVVANNIANVNTYGYKTKSSSFSDLVYNEMKTNGGEAKAGSGTKLDKSETVFAQGGLSETDSQYDFSIDGRGFFALRDPQTNETLYTRNGSFALSKRGDNFYLASKEGYFVLGKDGQPIVVNSDEQSIDPAIFDFPKTEGLICEGDTNFKAEDRNGTPYLTEKTARHKCLEASNVDLPQEFTNMIEAQRAYQYSLKVVQTSDEIQELINNLR